MSNLNKSIAFFFFYLPGLLFAETTKKSAEYNQVEPFSVMNMLNMVMGLVIVVALILGLAWAARKYGRLPTNSQVDMKVLGGLSLGTRERAVLIEVEGKRLLLGVAPGRVETLHVMGDEENTNTEFDKNLTAAMEVKS
jgi:flagellar protein FliO/FliZ